MYHLGFSAKMKEKKLNEQLQLDVEQQSIG